MVPRALSDYKVGVARTQEVSTHDRQRKDGAAITYPPVPRIQPEQTQLGGSQHGCEDGLPKSTHIKESIPALESVAIEAGICAKDHHA